jgi:hypothetical protein
MGRKRDEEEMTMLPKVMGKEDNGWRLSNVSKTFAFFHKHTHMILINYRYYTGRWFGSFFIFPYIGKNNPN